jgi:8-oxo-dGTP diphosphatase
MAPVPVTDTSGNTFVGVKVAGQSSLDGLDPLVALPLSLIVVEHGLRVLMVFDTRRRRWELPGGQIEHGESSLEAAIRELAEETGLDDCILLLGAVAEFVLGEERRREYAAAREVLIGTSPVRTTRSRASAISQSAICAVKSPAYHRRRCSRLARILTSAALNVAAALARIWVYSW